MHGPRRNADRSGSSPAFPGPATFRRPYARHRVALRRWECQHAQGAGHSGRQQRVQLAGPLQRRQLVRTADRLPSMKICGTVVRPPERAIGVLAGLRADAARRAPRRRRPSCRAAPWRGRNRGRTGWCRFRPWAWLQIWQSACPGQGYLKHSHGSEPKGPGRQQDDQPERHGQQAAQVAALGHRSVMPHWAGRDAGRAGAGWRAARLSPVDAGFGLRGGQAGLGVPARDGHPTGHRLPCLRCGADPGRLDA